MESAVFGITRLIPDELAEIPLKLIRFRNHGVKGLMSKAFVPTDQEMGRYRQCAESMGFRHVLMR